MAASPPLTVVVVGAGLGGLLCANGLVHGIRDAPTAASDDATASAAGPAPVSSDAVTDEPHVSATTGMRVIVLERDESAHSRAQGYYIGVQGDGLDAIGQVGLRDKVLANVKPGEGPFVFATASGSELCALHPSKQSGSTFEAHSMHRQRLRDALLEPVEDFVRFGAHVTDVQQGDSDADPVTVVLDNGETIDADVVVGADGVNSTVARFMDLVDTRDDCQVRMLGGAVVDPDCTRMSTIHPSASTMMVVEQGPAMFIGTYTARSEDGVAAESTGDNVVNWGLGMPMEDKVPPSEWEETWIKEKVDAVALRDAAIANLTERGWKPEIVQLLKDTPADRLRCRDLFDRMPLSLSNGWKGRLTLLGDAAHPMTPYQGAGGNTAMADGASLSGILGHVALTTPAGKVATGAAVTSALREYEKEMFSRSTKYVNASRQACDAMHTTSAVKSTLRNTMMRGMGLVLRMMARR